MAAALSSNNQKYSVQSYHTLALETTYEAESPFMIGNVIFVYIYDYFDFIILKNESEG